MNAIHYTFLFVRCKQYAPLQHLSCLTYCISKFQSYVKLIKENVGANKFWATLLTNENAKNVGLALTPPAYTCFVIPYVWRRQPEAYDDDSIIDSRLLFLAILGHILRYTCTRRYDEVLMRFARQILSKRGLAFSGFNMMQLSPATGSVPRVPRTPSLCNVAARGPADNNILDEKIKHGPTLPESASRLPDVRKFDNTVYAPCRLVNAMLSPSFLFFLPFLCLSSRVYIVEKDTQRENL